MQILTISTTGTEKNLDQSKGRRDPTEELTVLTNTLNIATILAGYRNVNVIVPGGTLKKNSLSLFGVLAERGFKDFFCDKLFLGVDGFDLDFGISTPSPEEAHLNQIMIQISKEVIVLADSGKFDRRGVKVISVPTFG